MSVPRPPAGRAARGQHFLRSSRLAESIVRVAGVVPGDLVVDVGAGTGTLTAALRRAGVHVIALELDSRLAQGLRARFGRDEAVRVVEADARSWPWPEHPFAVVANLPFAAAAGILKSLLDDPARSVKSAHVIVQWELAAKRATAWPSTLRSVYWGAWWHLAVMCRLAPAAFSPPPSVASALLAITRRAEPLVPAEDAARYLAFLRAGWGDEPVRRALRGVVGGRELKRIAADRGFDDRSLPRDLDATQWAAIFARAGERPGPRRLPGS